MIIVQAPSSKEPKQEDESRPRFHLFFDLLDCLRFSFLFDIMVEW